MHHRIVWKLEITLLLHAQVKNNNKASYNLQKWHPTQQLTVKVIFLSAVSKSLAEELFPIIPYSRFFFLTNIIRKHLKSSLSRHYNFQLSDLNSYPSKKKRQYFHKKMQRELKKTRPKKQVCILFTKIKERSIYSHDKCLQFKYQKSYDLHSLWAI